MNSLWIPVTTDVIPIDSEIFPPTKGARFNYHCFYISFMGHIQGHTQFALICRSKFNSSEALRSLLGLLTPPPINSRCSAWLVHASRSLPPIFMFIIKRIRRPLWRGSYDRNREIIQESERGKQICIEREGGVEEVMVCASAETSTLPSLTSFRLIHYQHNTNIFI